MATRTVQNIIEQPGTNAPLVGKTVSIQLTAPSFTGDGTREKLDTRYATTDATGMWSCELEVNADLDPADTQYTVREMKGTIRAFTVPAGDPAVPVNLRDCLTEVQPSGQPVVSFQNAIDTAVNAVGGATVNTFSAIGTAPAASKHVFAADIMRNFRRGAPTEGWQLVDGAYVIPWDWYDPNNLLQLGTKLRDLIARQRTYMFTKTGRPGVAGVSPGYPAAQQGLGLELMFPNLGEIKIQPDPTAYTDIALLYRQPWLRRENGLAIRGNKGGTTLLSYMTSTATVIGNAYRPYPETPLRGGDIDGSLRGSSMPFTNAERPLYVSGGTGQVSTGAALDTWVYRDTCRAVIDQNVSAGSYTCHVNLADGLDSAWYTARGLTPTARKLNNRIAVGRRVRRPQGQNPLDTHEVKYADLPLVVAIDGNTTPGYTKTGPATITFDRPFLLDVVIANEFTNFPQGIHGTAVYGYLTAGSGGVENVESHALITVEEPLLCTNAYVGDLTVVADPTSPQKPSSAFAFQSEIRPLGENLGGFDIAQQIVDINGCHGWTLRGLTNYGAVGTTVPNSGMTWDATSSRGGRVEDIDVRSFPGPIAQAESYSDFVVRGGRVLNDHPVPSSKPMMLIANDSSAEMYDVVWEGRGQLVWQRGSADVGPTAFKLRGRHKIVVSDPNNGPQFRLGDFDPAATIDYDGYTLAGTARVRRTLDHAMWQDWQAVQCTQGTVTINLPVGALCDAWIRSPASLTNLTSVKLLTNGRSAPVSLLGVTATHLTNPGTDSVGDGVGTDTDRTFTCDPSFYNEISSASEGAVVRIAGFNPDGSDWYSSILSLVAVSGTIQKFVTVDLPPKAVTTGTAVSIGSGIIAGKKTRVSGQAASLWFSLSAVTGTPSASTFNLAKLEAEDAGERATLQITYAAPGPTDPTDTFAIRCLTRQIAVRTGSAMNSSGGPTVITGDRRGNAALAAVIAEGVKRDDWRDGTTDSGGTTRVVRTTDAAAIQQSTPLITSTVLVATLLPNTNYLFRAGIFFDCTATADLKLGWSLTGAGATGKWVPNGLGSGIAAGALTGVVAANQVDIGSTATLGGSNVGTVLAAQPWGVIQTSSAGATLAFRYAQQNQEATDLTIRALSWLEVTPLT